MRSVFLGNDRPCIDTARLLAARLVNPSLGNAACATLRVVHCQSSVMRYDGQSYRNEASLVRHDTRVFRYHPHFVRHDTRLVPYHLASCGTTRGRSVTTPRSVRHDH